MLTKAEFVTEILKTHPELKTRRQAGLVLDTVFATVGVATKKYGVFRWQKFGSFTIRKRKARQGHNPRTGAPLKIKATKAIIFRPAADLKRSL